MEAGGADLMTIVRPDCWVNDVVMNVFAELCRNWGGTDNNNAVFCTDSFFVANYLENIWSSAAAQAEAVCNHLEKQAANLSTLKHLLVIAHPKEYHWATIHVHLEDSCIEYLDPKQWGDTGGVMAKLRC